MDEIEHAQAMVELASVVDKVTAPETQHALRIIMRVLGGLNERLLDMQLEPDEDE